MEPTRIIDDPPQVLGLLARLCSSDPLCRSTEGLDDGCHFCGAPIKYNLGIVECVHDDACPWIATNDWLGRDRPKHLTRSQT